jgi:S-formylglutathione hydrolase FrmB
VAVTTLLALAGGGTGAAAAVSGRGDPRQDAAQASSARLPLRTSAPAQTLDISCPSPAMGGTLPARVYLPIGYGGGRARYPVVYFLHGLPAGPSTYKGFSFVAGAVAHSGHSAIVVSPQGARSADADPEYLDWSPKQNWPAAIASDLPRCVEARFRAIASRRGRALIGLSAGGFGAFNIGLRALSRFAAIESWSGYFFATDPSGLHKLELGSPDADSAAAVPPPARLAGGLRLHPAFIGFYVGAQDARFLQDNLALDRTLRRSRIPHVFRVYPGGHSVSLWAGQAPRWLGMVLARLEAPH